MYLSQGFPKTFNFFSDMPLKNILEKRSLKTAEFSMIAQYRKKTSNSSGFYQNIILQQTFKKINNIQTRPDFLLLHIFKWGKTNSKLNSQFSWVAQFLLNFPFSKIL